MQKVFRLCKPGTHSRDVAVVLEEVFARSWINLWVLAPEPWFQSNYFDYYIFIWHDIKLTGLYLEK